jgi:hypothetical protein
MDSPKNWPVHQGNDASSKRLNDSFLMMPSLYMKIIKKNFKK